MRIEQRDECWSAEALVAAYFPRIAAGLNVNGRQLLLTRNNKGNKYDIDWALSTEGNRVAVFDTEYKPNWIDTPYDKFSVARYTLSYNKGKRSSPRETVKVKYFRAYPYQSFWMPVRADYKVAAVVVGAVIVNSPITLRPQPSGFARDIEIFEFSADEMVFCEAFDTSIEDYILAQLEEAGVL